MILQSQNDLMHNAETLIVLADVLREEAREEDWDRDPFADSDDEFYEMFANELVAEGEDDDDWDGDERADVAELVELYGLQWMDLADRMTGKRGPYFQFPKSSDFFSCCLQASDCEFWYMFR